MPVIMPSLQRFVKNDDGSYSVIEQRKPYGKITGTQLSGLLGQNPWNTPFSTAVKMMRLYNQDKSGNPSIHAGVVIEPKILDYIGATHGDDIFQKREGDHEEWASDFEDEIFGGHIDGLMPDGSIVEIKTSSRPQDWKNGIPVYYHMQASLYAHFLKTDRIVFGVGFTDRATLSEPERWMPNKDNTVVIETGIMDGFDGIMEDAEKIYRETVLVGRTPVPDLNNPIDNEIVRYLDAQLWSDDSVKRCLNCIKELNDRLYEVKEMEEMLDQYKSELSLYMDYNQVEEAESDSLTVQRVLYSRASVDTNQLKKDGLYETYLKKKEYKSLKITNKRK